MLRLGDMLTLLGERQCLSAAHTGALVAERERRRAPASPAGRLALAGTCSAATIGREAPRGAGLPPIARRERTRGVRGDRPNPSYRFRTRLADTSLCTATARRTGQPN